MGRAAWDAAHGITGLAAVAETGAYSDLTGLPTLGSAAATSASDYATSTQGLKADSALQANPNIGNASGTSLSLSSVLVLETSGSAAVAGNLTLVGGAKTVSTSAATSTCVMFFQRKTTGGTIGFATTYSINHGTSFTLTSDSGLDTSIYSWGIVETQ